MSVATIHTDVLVVGAGAAGLFAASHLPQSTEVVVVDKGGGASGSSLWAQGGIAAAIGYVDSVDLHVADTISVAAAHADRSAVEVLCSEAPECVMELVELGCGFDRSPDGSLHLAREGGQSVARSAHSGDASGAAIMSTLRKHASRRVRRVPGACVKLAVVDGRCAGGWILTEEGVVTVHASATVLATGGVGGLFASTTNPAGATGDGIMLAWEAGAGLADLEFIQFHPTALAEGDGEQRVLVTEALRGAGAHVVDSEGRRFLFDHHSDGELAPRDIVARAISERRSFLDCRHLDSELLRQEFPTVTKGCERFGLDLSTDLIPVTPAAHYFVGGITTDLDGRTSIPRLYAVGECANTGVHGANRLPGNSLAEALVFARRAARAIAGQRTASVKSFPPPPQLGGRGYRDDRAWSALRAACTRGLGVRRTPEGMAEVAEVAGGYALGGPVLDRANLELRGAATVARLIARSAHLRTESRGVHFRTDQPQPNPAWAGVRLRVARD